MASLARKCLRCEGSGIVMIGVSMAAFVSGEAVNPEMRDCPVCRGTGEGTWYSAPNYASHVQGTNAPEGVQADGLRGRA